MSNSPLKDRLIIKAVSSELPQASAEQPQANQLPDAQHPTILTDTTDIIPKTGGDGPYQKLALLGLILPAIAVFSTILMLPYMKVVPKLLCAHIEDPDNYSPCTKTEACTNNYLWKVDTSNSIINWVVTYNLLCESEGFIKAIYYFFFGGFALGMVFLVPLVDYFGRKPLILFSCIVLFLIDLKSVLTSDTFSGTIVLFTSGICIGVFYASCIIYISELTTQNSAGLYVILFHLAFSIAAVFVAAFFHYFPSWRKLQVVVSLIPLTLIVYFQKMAESPRLLASRGRFPDAKEAMAVIAKCNSERAEKWSFAEYESSMASASPKNDPGQGGRRSLLDYSSFESERRKKFYQWNYLLGNESTRNNLFWHSLLLACSGFGFAGLALTQVAVFDNIFLNDLVLYAIEFCMVAVTGFFIQVMGTKKVIFGSLTLSGILCLVCSFWIIVTQYGRGAIIYFTKLFSLAGFLSSIAYAAQVFPARVRGSALSIVLTSGVLGIVVGAFMLEKYYNLHYLFGIVSLCGIVSFKHLVATDSYKTSFDDIYEIYLKRPGLPRTFKIETNNEMKASRNNRGSEIEEEEKKAAPEPSFGKDKAASPRELLPSVPNKGATDIQPEVPMTTEPATTAIPSPDPHKSLPFAISGAFIDPEAKPLPFSILNISLSGAITGETKPEIGTALEGQLKGNTLTLKEKLAEGKVRLYEGTRSGSEVKGNWTCEDKKGTFALKFELIEFTGTLGKDKPLKWFISDPGQDIGFGGFSEDAISGFLYGKQFSIGKLRVTIQGPNGELEQVNAEIDQGGIKGKQEKGSGDQIELKKKE